MSKAVFTRGFVCSKNGEHISLDENYGICSKCGSDTTLHVVTWWYSKEIKRFRAVRPLTEKNKRQDRKLMRDASCLDSSCPESGHAPHCDHYKGQEQNDG